jgi:hypothetical protein
MTMAGSVNQKLLQCSASVSDLTSHDRAMISQAYPDDDRIVADAIARYWAIGGL